MAGVLRVHGATAAPQASLRNLRYHRGPVMRTNTTYAIYWLPPGTTMSADYQTVINQYFTDVAADSGTTTNVYSTETQYYDRLGGSTNFIAYASTFGGSYVDTDVFPANGCAPYGSYSVCLSDAQIAAEVQKVRQLQGWTGGVGNAFFVFLPKDVGTCSDSSCAFTYFCAHHSWIGRGATATLYANMPYADTAPTACGTGQSPNGSEADDTINVMSHEHREMINDPTGTGWFDLLGSEGSDKCAWNFGAPLGSAGTGAYNQVIGGHLYYLQMEWTNAHSGCVERGF